MTPLTGSIVYFHSFGKLATRSSAIASSLRWMVCGDNIISGKQQPGKDYIRATQACIRKFKPSAYAAPGLPAEHKEFLRSIPRAPVCSNKVYSCSTRHLQFDLPLEIALVNSSTNRIEDC